MSKMNQKKNKKKTNKTKQFSTSLDALTRVIDGFIWEIERDREKIMRLWIVIFSWALASHVYIKQKREFINFHGCIAKLHYIIQLQL